MARLFFIEFYEFFDGKMVRGTCTIRARNMKATIDAFYSMYKTRRVFITSITEKKKESPN